jgi:chemotaxis protein methyltransferase CheR
VPPIDLSLTPPFGTPLSGGWTDIIREASERVTALVPVREAPGPSHQKASDLTQVLELLRSESFASGLVLVRDLPPELADKPEVLLVKAMLLAHSGELAEAEGICDRLLRIEELNAGAHYVLALCREGAGDPEGAAEHDRVAIYLDPGFAMPRLHLGLLARRTGDPASARRELWQALVLLRREDAARLLLFGGGFSREVVIALCRSALRDCGGEP